MIRMSIAGIINHLNNFKTQGDTTVQQVAGVHGELEAAMSKVSQCQGHSSPCAPRPSRIQHLSPNKLD